MNTNAQSPPLAPEGCSSSPWTSKLRCITAALAAVFLAFGCGPEDPEGNGNGNGDPDECLEEPCDEEPCEGEDCEEEPCEGEDCEEPDPCDPNPCLDSAGNRARCVADDEGGWDCLCDQGFHESGGLCCPPNSSSEGGACVCDEGYEEQDGGCVVPPDPCMPNPCTGVGINRNTCEPDDSAEGYRCECNQGYEDSDGSCVLTIWEICPDELVCRADVCVPHDLSNEQCLTDDDCRVSNPSASSFCNASAAGGICLGCVEQSDCPSGTECTMYGTCAIPCDHDSDCPHGRCYTQSGYCGQARCSSNEDCHGGTVCIDDSGDGLGMCLRIPCNETECSPTNPGGTCPNPGEACLYGACHWSCDPNPCTVEANKTVCTMEGGAPTCSCATDYELDTEGRCVPEAIDCPTGFSCADGYCADFAEEAFQCAVDTDCGPGLNCSPSLPSGTCQGCEEGKPCPEGFDCVFEYCMRACQSSDDCHPAMTCRNNRCGRMECSEPTDCPEPYVCVTGTDGGTCGRPICEG